MRLRTTNSELAMLCSAGRQSGRCVLRAAWPAGPAQTEVTISPHSNRERGEVGEVICMGIRVNPSVAIVDFENKDIYATSLSV